MKSLIQAVAVAVALVAPVASFAQSNGPVTRAQVRAELVQLENAGYHVGDGDQAHYPDAIQAAEAKVAAQQVAANGGKGGNSDNSGYGGVASGSSDAGRPAVSKADWNAMYSHH
jgi:UDP-N-acetylmuramyl tripeptide synthase